MCMHSTVPVCLRMQSSFWHLIHIAFFLVIADVEFYWHERNLLIISPIHKEDFGIGSRAQYEVSIAY